MKEIAIVTRQETDKDGEITLAVKQVVKPYYTLLTQSREDLLEEHAEAIKKAGVKFAQVEVLQTRPFSPVV